MRRLLFLLTLAILLIPQIALADGGVFPNYREKVYLPSQKAVVGWDGSTETLILSTKIKIENLANVGWVIPISSSVKPEVEEGNISIFYDLAKLFKGSKKSWTPGIGLEDTGEVEIIEVTEVDIYDVVILKATGAEVLVNWLNDNGYLMPEDATSVLQDYCEGKDFYFVANKVDLANRYADLEITEADRTCAQGISDSIMLYSGGPTLEYQVEAAVEDSEICKGASVEAVKLLVELELGVATPLKISFSPASPYYPLKMSSINEGETLIGVYVFSAEPVKDASGLLTLSKMTANTSTFAKDYGLSQKYVTYLSFSGNLSDLSGDAWFESQDYNRNLDPNYVSLGGKIVELLSIALAFVLYVGYPVVFLVVFGFAVVGFVVAVRVIVRRIRRR